MEFHFPYYALREGVPAKDRRMLRGERLRRSEILPLAQHRHTDCFTYHEAQTSFLVTGVDEFFSTSYCFVDTYFGSEKMKSTYLEALNGIGLDPASCRPLIFPYWNPREYFLAVLATRIGQATMEWRNLIRVFDRRMKYYVSVYLSTILAILTSRRKSLALITTSWTAHRICGQLWVQYMI
jgi:hypothetical protein